MLNRGLAGVKRRQDRRLELLILDFFQAGSKKLSGGLDGATTAHIVRLFRLLVIWFLSFFVPNQLNNQDKPNKQDRPDRPNRLNGQTGRQAADCYNDVGLWARAAATDAAPSRGVF